jgi:Protein of unknown function (DUF2939)
MKAKIFLWITFILLIGIGFAATPLWTLYNLKEAADQKDATALSKYVDYSAVRENLKVDLKAKMASEMTERNDKLPGLAAGALATLAGGVIDPMVDALVTPDSLALVMKGQNPQAGKEGDKQQTSSSSKAEEMDTAMSYQEFNVFVVVLKQKGASDQPVTLIFKREKVIFWKLSAIRLPS